jgi:4-hydroxy-tetrahydrodipicolinate synthase
VTANIAPKLSADLHNACEAGDYEKALSIQDILTPLYWAMFLETNPTPVKFAASILGICESDVRLPMVSPGKEIRALIASTIGDVGLEVPNFGD